MADDYYRQIAEGKIAQQNVSCDDDSMSRPAPE
jgi:hypothetical protein